jgi:hypothetical protein
MNVNERLIKVNSEQINVELEQFLNGFVHGIVARATAKRYHLCIVVSLVVAVNNGSSQKDESHESFLHRRQEPATSCHGVRLRLTPARAPFLAAPASVESKRSRADEIKTHTTRYVIFSKRQERTLEYIPSTEMSSSFLPPALSFRAKLEARVTSIDSLLCVGLDPHRSELFATPAAYEAASADERCDAAFTFCKTLIDMTLPYAACYKPNAAFFEALGDNGGAVLRRIVRTVIPHDVPVLLDVKRGDIGSTASAYAEACFDHIGADAVTLSPLMGWDSVEPFVTGT